MSLTWINPFLYVQIQYAIAKNMNIGILVDKKLQEIGQGLQDVGQGHSRRVLNAAPSNPDGLI